MRTGKTKQYCCLVEMHCGEGSTGGVMGGKNGDEILKKEKEKGELSVDLFKAC